MNEQRIAIANPQQRTSRHARNYGEPPFSVYSSSLLGSFKIACVCVLALISQCFLFVGQPAFAATWPVPTSQLSASLGFDQNYSAGAISYAHSGIDIPASAGMQISSPLAGTVRFTGAVPSGDSRIGGSSSSKTMDAVSIEVQDGRVITLMPFASIAVAEGQQVAEGAYLGTLAAGGDISTSHPHLHLGYRQGRSYLDPMQIFGAQTSSQAEEAAAGASAASAPPAEQGSMPAAQEAPMSTSLTAMSQQAAPTPAQQASPAAQQESFGTIETGSYELAQPSSQQIPLLSDLGSKLSGIGMACCGQLVDFAQALSALSHGTGIPLPIIVMLFALLFVSSLALLALMFFRCLGRRVGAMRKSRKESLSAVLGGDSMHKLFPASGAAFMSRSRIARGR